MLETIGVQEVEVRSLRAEDGSQAGEGRKGEKNGRREDCSYVVIDR